MDLAQTNKSPEQFFDGLLVKCLNNHQIAAKLFDKFCEGLPQYFAEIPKNCCRDDLPAMKKAAHKLKGAAGTLGADAIADAARRVDEAAKADDFESAESAFREVLLAIDNFLDWANAIEDAEAFLQSK